MLRRALRESKAAERSSFPPSPVEKATPRRRESYYWHGHRYEIDEDTRPEWIDAGRRKSTKPSTLKSLDDSTPPPYPYNTQAPKSLIVKLRVPMAADQYVAPVAQMVAATAPMMPSSTTNYAAILVSIRKPWKTFWDFDDEVRDTIYRHATRRGSVIQVDWENGPPFLGCEPVISRLNRQTRQESLPIFYRENTFECPFHHTLYKFVMQIPRFVLPHLHSVRLSHPLGYAGFVRTLLDKLNERTKDGLRSGVVKVAMTIEGEKNTVMVGLEDLDAFVGIEGDWHGLKVARRKQPLKIENTVVANSSDDEDESPVIKPGRKRKSVWTTSEEDETEDEPPTTRPTRNRKKTWKVVEEDDEDESPVVKPEQNRKRSWHTSEDDDTEDEPPVTRPRRNRKKTRKLVEDDEDAEEALIAYERRQAASASVATSQPRPQFKTPQSPRQAKPRSRGSRVELRKPDSMSEEKWNGLSRERQVLHSGAGRMLETDDGQLRAGGPCGRCVSLGKDPAVCREYTDQARRMYDGTQPSRSCAPCRVAQQKCADFTVDDSDDDDWEPPS